MKDFFRILTIKVLTVMFFISPWMLQAGEAERQAAGELLEATRFEKIMEDSTNAAIQMVKQANPEIAPYEATLRKFYKKHMGAESLKEEMVAMYAEIFSAKELKDIAAFYKTPAGQKALEKIPEIMQRAMQIAHNRLFQHMGELQEMLEEESQGK